MNFVINSTELDASTRANVNILALTLIDEEFSGNKFMLIGHADVVGDADANLRLSERRANAIYDAITEIQPNLAGRIETAGRGEQKPLSLGTTASDHRLNRRLEVILLTD